MADAGRASGGTVGGTGTAEVRRVSPRQVREAEALADALVPGVALSVRVTLRGGELDGAVTGSVAYGSRTAHTSIPLPTGHKTALREVLETILRDCAEDAARAAKIGAARAIVVAADRGEAL